MPSELAIDRLDNVVLTTLECREIPKSRLRNLISRLKLARLVRRKGYADAVIYCLRVEALGDVSSGLLPPLAQLHIKVAADDRFGLGEAGQQCVRVTDHG